MSIGLKQAAQQAVDAFDAFGDADDFASLFELTQKMRALRAAIQQAEAQQPATGEPVAHLWQHGETGRTRIVMLGDVWTANDHWCYVGPLVLGSTHLAPSVPAAVARDAISTVREHYRGTDWGKAAESICDAIDAMLAAK